MRRRPLSGRGLARDLTGIAVLVLACGCATTQEVETAPQIPGKEVEVVEEPGFFGTHFPLWPDDQLVAPVADAKAWVYLVNLVPLGGLWGPLLLLDEEGRPPLGGDVVVPYLVPWLTGVATGLCLTGPLTAVGLFATGVICAVPTGGIGFILVPISGCCLVGPGCLLSLVPAGLVFWVAPTSSVNGWNRAYLAAQEALPAPPATPAPPPSGEQPAPLPPPPGAAEEPVAPPAAPEEKSDEGSKQPAQRPAAPSGRDVDVDDEGWVPY